MTLKFDQETIATILRSTPELFPLPTINDPARWEAVRSLPQTQQALDHGKNERAVLPPHVLATDYLAFVRDGNREPHQKPVDARRDRLIFFTMSECLERQGNYLDAITNEAWAICEESSWVVPAHDPYNDLGLPRPNQQEIDLWSATTAFTLAEVSYILSDTLHSVVRERIAAEVDRRSTSLFLERNDFAWLGYGKKKLNNWMPVCAGGSAIAALYLEKDINRLAAVLAKALHGIDRYLNTFGTDGGCAEGVGYWEKGLSYVFMLGEILATRSAGQIDILDDSRLRAIADFPARVELSPGTFVAFSDSGISRKPQAAFLHFLGRRYDMPRLLGLDSTPLSKRTLTNRGPGEKLRDLFWFQPGDVPEKAVPPPADYLSDVQWLIARAQPANPEGLVLAAKAGHNAEPHNHNDIGSFMVHWHGESLLSELSAMRYVRDSFKAETRYSYLANRSLGHSVPYVNHCEQQAGAEYAARNVRYTSSTTHEQLALELTNAYPAESDLSRLERTVTLWRDEGAGRIELSDEVSFAKQPGIVSSVLISFYPISNPQPGELHIQGAHGALRVTYDADLLEAVLETIEAVDLRDAPRDVTRVQLQLRQPSQTTKITLFITPTNVA